MFGGGEKCLPECRRRGASLPVYDYDLHCKAFFDGEEKDFRFLMRNKTFIYDTVALYRFDAKRYFPKELWQKLHTVYDSDYNRESDRRFPKPEGDYMPESLRRVLRYGGGKKGIGSLPT